MPLARSSVANVLSSAPGNFSTNFPATENPISQGSLWLNGGSVVLDSTNVQTTPGLAFATQVAHGTPPFDDSIAILDPSKITFIGPNQYAMGTVFNSSANLREVELRLRSTFAAHSNLGYEIDCTTNFGCSLVRIDGPINTFTVLVNGATTNVSLANGAGWYAQMIGTRIIVTCNPTGIASILSPVVINYDTSADTTKYSTGMPGIGFYSDTDAGSPTANNTLGWANFACGNA